MGGRVEGATVSCRGCGEVVYPDCKVLAKHDVRWLNDGRAHWWSRDFQITVHLCRSAASEAAVETAEPLADRMLAGLTHCP